VTDPINRGDVKGSLRPVPELPSRLTALFPMVVVGTLAWFAGFVVFAIRDFGGGRTPSLWLWTCLAGVVISFIGMGIMTWQRAAARRGSRSAQTGL
jgi:uncharacterized membrane protein SirB2